MSFLEKLSKRSQQSLLCVGLDVDLAKIPRSFIDEQIAVLTGGHPPKVASGEEGELELHRYIAQSDRIIRGIMTEFTSRLMLATAEYALCFKANLGFYLAQYPIGIEVLRHAVAVAHELGVPVILDGKFGDIGNSSDQYARFAYEIIGADAVTVSPYLGFGDGLRSFIGRGDKGVFVLCHTSNDGSRDFQELDVDCAVPDKLYQHVATLASQQWNSLGNVGLVVGATFPKEIGDVRRLVGDSVPFLIPGLGKQKGDLEQSVRAGVDAQGDKAIFNVSREILYASSDEDFVQAAVAKAKWYRDEINKFRQKGA